MVHARMYLYKYMIPCTGSWFFLGCYGEEDHRILRHQLQLSGGINNEYDKQAYSYADSENGKQCFCDNLVNPPGELPPGSCS